MRAKIENKYTEEFKHWCASRYLEGKTMGAITQEALATFPDLRGTGFNRNCVLGIVHRAGVTTKKLLAGVPRMADLTGGRASHITLPGPAWAIPNLPRVRGIAA